MRLFVGQRTDRAGMANFAAVLMIASLLCATTTAGTRATLRLISGDYLSGELHESTGGEALRWQAPWAAGALEFPLTAIASVDFDVANPQAAMGEYCFELTGGDQLFGALAALDENLVEINSPQLGRITINRNALRRLSRWGDGDDLVYLGPNGLQGWKNIRPEKPWQDLSGQLATKHARALIYGDVSLPDRAAIEVELSWSAEPDFSLRLGVDDDAESETQPYCVQVWGGLPLLVGERDAAGDVVHLSLADIAPVAGRLQLQLYLDQNAGRMIACSADGRVLGELLLPPSGTKIDVLPGVRLGQKNRRGVQLLNRSGDVRLERLRITRWDGQPPQQVVGDGSRFHDIDGGVNYGELTSYDPDAQEFVIQQDDQPTAVPADQISNIVFAGDRDASTAVKDKSRLVRAVLHNGARLSGELQNVDATHLQIMHPDARQPIAVPIAQLNALAGLRPGEPLRWKREHQSTRMGRLESDDTRLHGGIIDGDAVTSPDDGASCLVFRPRGAANSSPLRSNASARIVYRDRPQPTTQPARPQRVVVQQQRGFLGGLVRAFSGQQPTPTRPPSPLRTSIHLRTGDIIPCKVTGISERGVAIESTVSDAKLVPHDEVKAAVLRARRTIDSLDDPKRARLLTLPRMQKNNPPTHLLCTADGDYLRCRLLDMDEKFVTVEVRLETKQIDRRHLVSVIWLHHDDLQTDELPADDDEVSGTEIANRSMQVQAVRSDGIRLTFTPSRVERGMVYGESAILGACRAQLEKIDQLLIGQAIHAAAAELAFQQWKLRNAPQPRFMTEQAGGGSASEGDLVGKPAPDFELDLLDGARFRLADQYGDNRGKITVLDFWASWCGPCIQAMPQVDKIVSEFADRDVQLIAVNLQESAKKIEATLKRLDLDLTVALDEDGVVADRYQVTGVPQTVIIDRDGNVARLFVGGGRQMEEQLRAALIELTND